jgi:hypothetical protein
MAPEQFLYTSNILKLLGGALLATGLLGGGFEVMAAKLPVLTNLNRIIVVIGGALLLTTGVYWGPDQPDNTASLDPETAQSSNTDE